MTTGKLPPKPDPVTGLPTPPKAPLAGSWGRGYRESTDRSTTPPDPPPDQGPTLEWTTTPWKGVPWGVAFMIVLAAVFLTLRNGGIDWATHWLVWLVIFILSLFGVLFATWASGGMAAGAEWLRDGKDWVRTYELADVQLGVPRSKDRLVLKDAAGRTLWVSLMSIQANLDLWDLVYNGMLHSVHGGASVNERAREELWLDPQLHLIHDDDPRGEL